MNILITGAGGFVGRHLIAELVGQPNATLYAAVYRSDERQASTVAPATPVALDLRDADAVRMLVEQTRPQAVYHLAALADVAQSFRQPWSTLENNILAQLNLLEALRTLAPQAGVLVISSAEIYGAADATRSPLDETRPFQPNTPYSVSKVAQDMLALQYFLAHDMPIIRARPFNHTGPGQARGFVAADFASQIAAIEVGLAEPVLYVGNLDAERDFTDVRDVVRAYDRLLGGGQPGEAYNVCSGRAYSIRYLLDVLLSYSTAQIDVRADPERMRPSDVPHRVGDASKLRADTGWEPAIPFEQTLLDLLNDWRARLWPEAGLGGESNA